MAGRRLVAGVDSSTQSTKVVIVDVDTGEVLEEASAPHHPDISGDAAEDDPERWWTALREALAACSHAGGISAIGVGAQQRGLVVSGEGSTALRRAVLWCDARSVGDAADMTTSLGGPGPAAEMIGVPPQPAYTGVLWHWLRRTDPDLVDRVERIHQPHGWLVWRLTGAHTIDPGDASTTTWWSTTSGDYVDAVLDLPGMQVDRALLPQVLPSSAAAGEVTPEAAQALGIPAGSVVSVGTGDNPAAALPLVDRVGDLVMSLGTSGTLFTRTTEPSVDPSAVVLGNASAEGDFLPLVCVINCTRAVDQVARTLGLGRDDVAPSSDGVVSLPYLIGEWTPQRPSARGLVYGMTATTSREQILRATYEGVIWSLLSGLEDVRAQIPGGGEDPRLRIIGGGARSSVWPRIAANLWGGPVRVPRPMEFVALGAAMSAAAALTGEDYATLRARWDIGADDVEVVPDSDASSDPSGRIAEVVAATAELMALRPPV